MYLHATKEWGLTIEMINDSCPSDLEPYVNAYQLGEQQKDEARWMVGIYVQSAVSVAVEHVLGGKKAKSKYIEKPLFSLAKEKQDAENLTEEEKARQTEQLFMRLKIMQSNFKIEKNHKKEPN